MAKNKRVNVKAILADPDLRRKLMVSTIQATQAREGIDTTEEQADRAYHVVTESDKTAFFDLERFRGSGQSEPDRREEMFVRALTEAHERVRFDVARRDFATIDSSPLAFRRLSIAARIFRDGLPLATQADVCQGLITRDDARYIRYFWEVLPNASRRPWIAFHKGGEFSRFYFDPHLVINWSREAQNRFHRLRDTGIYFHEGLTFPRAAGVFNVRMMNANCVFSDKGPAILPRKNSDLHLLSGLLNSTLGLYLLGVFSSRKEMGGRWEILGVKRFPIVAGDAFDPSDKIRSAASLIKCSKNSWDKGNEVSTCFTSPWILHDNLSALPVPQRLEHLTDQEATEEARIQQVYAELNDEVYKLYGIRDATRAIIEETLGECPPEILWPQMQRKTVEQKRMEHVWRLLSYAVKRVVEADDDGIVPFAPLSGETNLIDRVHQQLAQLFPEQDVNQVEVEITNELKRKVKGYKRASSIGQWLDNVYFDYHASLYKSRPIIWHVASSQGSSPFAFGALCHYHKFDRNRIAKLRASYLRDAIEAFRREAALADQAGRAEDRVEWQSKLEEAQALDRRLQAVQEGHHEGAEGGDRDYRILTPWKSPEDRPKGWDPDIDDGVKVNIEPLQKAGVLRIGKVVR